VPWLPWLFSGPALERIFDRAAADARAAAPVPYFAGVTSGETDALLQSFAGEPELHHPIRGHVKGRRAFERFVTETNAWLTAHNAVCGHVERIVTPRHGIEETVLTLDGDQGRVELPIAIVADRDEDARIIELRVYYGAWPLTGRHANRPPLLQPDPDLQAPDVVGEYQRALAAGDVEGTVAASSTAPSPTTAARAHWSTTWSDGARPSCGPRPGLPSTSVAAPANSPAPAYTTTPTRRSALSS
jgi:hypothetical protein